MKISGKEDVLDEAVPVLRLGFFPNNLWGIDILKFRIQKAILTFCNINFECSDASHMKFEDKTFDIVIGSTIFVQVKDSVVSQQIASEMLRVTKSKGWIIISDWRYSKPWDSTYLGLSKKRIVRLFGEGDQTQLHSTYKGALIPPIGRFLSEYIPCLYFLVQRLFPFLTGEIVTVLRKTA
jgi:ubiquinone/menaquinone biosynthesis C-methylase UbiE